MPAMKIENYTSDSLTIDRFEAVPGQAWCILGSNRSGIDTFLNLFSKDIRVESNTGPGNIQYPENYGIFSFASQQDLFEQELRKDDTDFLDRIDPGTPARNFLKSPEDHMELIRALAMERVLAQGYRQLSTGQSRKLLLLSQITRGKKLLIIQAPYEGLDIAGCRELDKALAHCHEMDIQLLITIHNPEDIPFWATHVGVLDRGAMVLSGTRKEVIEKVDQIPGTADFKVSVRDLNITQRTMHSRRELVRLENGAAGYQGTLVFEDIDLTVNEGDHTLVTGPNGSGKSTLLQVIIGDHPACYRNDLSLFGIRRGTGESIWDLKQKMGIVSPELHRNYIVPGSTLDCVLSGLYDSIGLYTAPSPEDRSKGMAWLERIGLAHNARTSFRNLSYADQRLVLIARSLIKLPDLLILDEPTQGLDRANREAILDFLEQVAKEKLSTVLYVSHRQDEFRKFFVSTLDMGRTTD